MSFNKAFQQSLNKPNAALKCRLNSYQFRISQEILGTRIHFMLTPKAAAKIVGLNEEQYRAYENGINLNATEEDYLKILNKLKTRHQWRAFFIQKNATRGNWWRIRQHNTEHPHYNQKSRSRQVLNENDFLLKELRKTYKEVYSMIFLKDVCPSAERIIKMLTAQTICRCWRSAASFFNIHLKVLSVNDRKTAVNELTAAVLRKKNTHRKQKYSTMEKKPLARA